MVWKAVLLALEARSLPVSHWQEVLPDTLHSIRSLLCTVTNATPHERMFLFPRKSASVTSLPSWLTSPGPVLLRKHVRGCRVDPLVENVHLLHANPQYAYIAYPNGKEKTISIKDLAPSGVPATPDPQHSPLHPLACYYTMPATVILQPRTEPTNTVGDIAPTRDQAPTTAQTPLDPASSPQPRCSQRPTRRLDL